MNFIQLPFLLVSTIHCSKWSISADGSGTTNSHFWEGRSHHFVWYFRCFNSECFLVHTTFFLEDSIEPSQHDQPKYCLSSFKSSLKTCCPTN
jgi:hypothetical protein